MISRLFLTVFLVIGLNNFVYSIETDCSKYKKFTINYMQCKARLVKDRTISTSKNFVKDTKDYQEKKWSEEKEKVNKIKEKVLEK